MVLHCDCGSSAIAEMHFCDCGSSAAADLPCLLLSAFSVKSFLSPSVFYRYSGLGDALALDALTWTLMLWLILWLALWLSLVLWLVLCLATSSGLPWTFSLLRFYAAH